MNAADCIDSLPLSLLHTHIALDRNGMVSSSLPVMTCDPKYLVFE